MTITKIIVPAPLIEVGHVVDNRKEELEVIGVEARNEYGNKYYHVSIGRNGVKVFSVDLNEVHTLTYTYQEGK
jgi:hypothetical protein